MLIDREFEMSLYFISYDLRKEKNYNVLYKELHSFNAVQILDSTWCFNRLNTSTKDLRDYFTKFIDSDDSLIISKVTDWASIRTSDTPNSL